MIWRENFLPYLFFTLIVTVAVPVLSQSENLSSANYDARLLHDLDEDVDSFLIKQSERVLDRLAALKSVLKKEEIDGITYKTNAIHVDASKHPEFTDLLYVFDLFASTFKDADLRNLFEHKLLENGFHEDDLIYLEDLADDSWQQSARQQKARHFLDHPTKEELASVSNEEILDYLESVRKNFIETSRANVAHFLKKIPPPSRRVLVEAVFERVAMGNTGINYRLQNTLENAQDYRAAWSQRLSD